MGLNERKNPKREKLKKDFKTSLKFAKGVIRKIDTFMKSNDWGVVDGFVTNKRTGLASLVKDMEKSMNQIIKLPVDESVNEADVSALKAKMAKQMDMVKKHRESMKKHSGKDKDKADRALARMKAAQAKVDDTQDKIIGIKKESVNERSAISLNLWIKEFERLAKKNRMKPVDFIKKHISKRKGMDNQVVKDVLKHFQKKESVNEAPITSPSQLPYSSPEAQKMAEKDIIGMSKILGKASQMSIKKMMDGVKAKKYDAFDLQRAIMSGPIRDTHTGERDFMRVLWNKVRSGFRRYSKRGKLR